MRKIPKNVSGEVISREKCLSWPLVSLYPKSRGRKHSKPPKLKYVKMMVVDDLQANTIAAVVENDIDPSSTIISYAYAVNNRIKEKARYIKQMVHGTEAG